MTSAKKSRKSKEKNRTSQCGDENPLMAAVKPFAANPTVSVVSSLSAKTKRSTLNACTWGTCTPWLAPRATSPRRTYSPSSFCVLRIGRIFSYLSAFRQ